MTFLPGSASSKGSRATHALHILSFEGVTMQAVLDVGVMQLLSSDAGSRSWHLPKETEAGPSGCPSSNNS